MKPAIRTRIAHVLGNHLVRLMPDAHGDWAAGMKAEIETIESPGEALRFALGCVSAGFGRRLRTVSGALIAIRWAVAAATLLFAGAALGATLRLLMQGTSEMPSQVLGGLGLAFLTAGLTLVRAGPRGLAAVAAIMLALNTAGLMVHQTAPAHVEFYRALIIEGYLLWSLLLLAGLALFLAGRSPRLLAFAHGRGWEA